HFVSICLEELEQLMGPVDSTIAKAKYGPTKLMLVGLQGSGKTTTAGKLALHLRRQGFNPMLVAGDIYRPAAIEQLRVLARQLEIDFFTIDGIKPPDLATRAVEHAKENGNDLVIFDTAGRLAIDEAMMQELEEIKSRTKPDNIFFVCDAMIGQDAVRTAKAFNERLEIDGFIMTKLDGDARGGAALSIKEVTGKPIKFVGMGESLDKLEPFRPDGLASRILGMGDIVGLMQDFEQVVDEKQAEEDAMRMLKGQFTLRDFLEQIRTIKKMGSLQDIFEKMPFMSEQMPDNFQIDDKELVKIESIIQSMTESERNNPDVLSDSRYNRIAKGSGRTVNDVKDLVARFSQMRQVMGAIGKEPGLLSRIPGFKQLSQLKQLKQLQGMDMAEIFGGNAGGMPGMPGMGQSPEEMEAERRRNPKYVDKESKKKKRKAERKARKKSRRR
ncbi:MAG: signal recognition particle protein Srp54, partial [Myxococcales bacterium]|nr:signal recognition particle protein Srp54 [Myxococcales bacterium]